ncbi:hypothetical protein BDV09DRAFT_149258 [Aspergillus tetrazonus]
MTDSDDLNPYPTGSSSSRCTTSVLGETVGKQISPHLRETKKKAKSPEIGELCHDCIQAVIIRSAHLGDTTQHHHCHISVLPWEKVSKSAESAGSFLQSQTEELKLLPKAAYAPGRRHNPTVQKCLLFFSLPSIFFHCPLVPFSSFRPETPARDSCKFPSDLSALRSLPTNQDRRLHVLVDTDSRAGDCWLHVGRAM